MCGESQCIVLSKETRCCLRFATQWADGTHEELAETFRELAFIVYVFFRPKWYFCIVDLYICLRDQSGKATVCASWYTNVFIFMLFNPFDTEPMVKIAVKISIMRVVKFMSSPGNDFTSWQKHHQLFFGGPSTEPTLVPLFATRWLLGTINVRNLEWKFRIFSCLMNFGSHWCQRLQE